METNSSRDDLSGGHHEEPEGEEGWLTSYADLITMLLAVFVTLFSMSTLDQQKVKELSNAVSNYMTKKEVTAGVKEDVTAVERQAEGMRLLSMMLDLGNTDDVLARILKIQGDANESRRLKTLSEKLGLMGNGSFSTVRPQFDFVFPETLLFTTGSNELSPIAKVRLSKLAPRLREAVRKTGAALEIAGHTDSAAPARGATSNTELSTARAASVFRFLLEQGIAENKMRVSGKGASEPLLNASGAASNQNNNRRVVISILSVR